MSGSGVQAYELYRTSSLGVALTDTLDDLISSNQIEPQLAMKILGNFDKAFAEIIAEKVKSRLSFKGHLDTYRFCDDVWTFMVKDVSFKLDSQSTLKSDKIKIIALKDLTPPGSRILSLDLIERLRVPNLQTSNLKDWGLRRLARSTSS